MAETGDYDDGMGGNGAEFQQDVMDGFDQGDDGMNGDGMGGENGAPADSGSAEAPGRDDDR